MRRGLLQNQLISQLLLIVKILTICKKIYISLREETAEEKAGLQKQI